MNFNCRASFNPNFLWRTYGGTIINGYDWTPENILPFDMNSGFSQGIVDYETTLNNDRQIVMNFNKEKGFPIVEVSTLTRHKKARRDDSTKRNTSSTTKHNRPSTSNKQAPTGTASTTKSMENHSLKDISLNTNSESNPDHMSTTFPSLIQPSYEPQTVQNSYPFVSNQLESNLNSELFQQQNQDYEMQEADSLNTFENSNLINNCDNDDIMEMIPTHLILNKGSNMSHEDKTIVNSLKKLPKHQVREILEGLDREEEMEPN